MHNTFWVSSYGRVGFDGANSHFVRVARGTNAPAAGGECEAGTEIPIIRGMVEAQTSPATGLPFDYANYDIAEYFLPHSGTSYSACGYVGLANMCVPRLGAIPAPEYGCWSYMHTGLVNTRSHEFAHNFGLSHTNANGGEYGGGALGVLSSGSTVSPANRVAATWLSDYNHQSGNGALRLSAEGPGFPAQAISLSSVNEFVTYDQLDSEPGVYKVILSSEPHTAPQFLA